MKAILVTVSLLFLAGLSANGQPGSLDPTFGAGGVVYTDLSFGSGGGYATSVAIQPLDGKIVISAIYDNYPAGTGRDFYVVRYNSDGTLDHTFGSGGVSRFAMTAAVDNEGANAVAIQPDGKIVVAGNIPGSAGVARLNADGSLDTTFGSGGKKTFVFVNRQSAVANSVLIQPDGRIVAVGASNNASFAFARFTTTGADDTSFNGTGFLNVKTGAHGAKQAAIQPDGKIVAAGIRSGTGGSSHIFGVVRVNSNGTPDTTFGTGGQVSTNLGKWWSMAWALKIDQAGKIVVAGSWYGTSQDSLVVIRYNSNGQLDTTFGNGGKFISGVPGYFSRLYGVAIQSDGKIVAAGWRYLISVAKADFALIRLNPNGTLDASFDSDGVVLTALTAGDDRVNAMAIQANGKIVVVGHANAYSATVIGVVRYLP